MTTLEHCPGRARSRPSWSSISTSTMIRVIRRDLHREYARLLEQAPPIFWTPANGGHWMVTRYDAITSVVLDTTHFSNAQSEIPAAENANKLIPVNYDPPENMGYRKILMPYFSPKAVKDLEARIDFHANQIVDTVKEKGRCDFVKEVAAPFPITVFMILMGLPLERYDGLATHGGGLLQFRGYGDAGSHVRDHHVRDVVPDRCASG